MNKLITLLKGEPVRVVTGLLAAALLVTSLVTKTSVEVLAGQLVAFTITMEKVRAMVTPMAKVLATSASGEVVEGAAPEDSITMSVSTP